MTIDILAELEPWEWPEDAKSIILSTIRDAEASYDDRLLATELAGDFVVVDDEIVDELLTILQDASESDEMRGRAAISFGPALEQAHTEEFYDPDDVPISEDAFNRIQATLERLFNDPSVPTLVRRRVFEAAIRAPQEWNVQAIREAYASDDADWKLTAVFAMQYVRGFDEEILESLESDDEMIHYHAVQAAGSWSVKGAWKHVAGIVQDPAADTDLRLAAMESATTMNPAEARKLIVDLLHDSNEDIAAMASESLAMAEALEEMGAFDDEFDDEDEDDDEGR